MKKISMIFLCFTVILLVTGCGPDILVSKQNTADKEKTLICTTTENEEGMDILETISMTYKNNKLSHMTMAVSTKISDPDIQNNWDLFIESMNEQNEEFTKDGISLKIENNKQNYEYTTTLDIDITKASEEDLEEQGFSSLKEDDSTLESTKEEAEKDGAVCEIR